MSKEALVKVVQRSIEDAAFRRQLATDAAGALRGYDLTVDEVSAMRSRDVARLTAFGVDIRMSKVFTLDPGTTGAASVKSDIPRDSAPVWIGDTAAPAHTYSGDDNAGPEGALTGVSGPRDSAPVWIGDTAAPAHTYSGDDNAGPEGALTGGSEPRDSAPTWIGDSGAARDGYATDEGQLTNGVEGSGHIQITTGDGDLAQ